MNKNKKINVGEIIGSDYVNSIRYDSVTDVMKSVGNHLRNKYDSSDKNKCASIYMKSHERSETSDELSILMIGRFTEDVNKMNLFETHIVRKGDVGSECMHLRLEDKIIDYDSPQGREEGLKHFQVNDQYQCNCGCYSLVIKGVIKNLDKINEHKELIKKNKIVDCQKNKLIWDETYSNHEYKIKMTTDFKHLEEAFK